MGRNDFHPKRWIINVIAWIMLFFMGKYKSKKVEDGGYLWNGGDAYASKCSNL